VNNEQDKPIAGHDYDGIEELDNPLPKWWLATFYGAIIFAVFYWGYFELGPGPSQDETLAKRMEKIEATYAEAAKEAEIAALALDASALLSDPMKLAKGKTRYVETCAVCHGQNGEGTIGPNLTDDYWIHSKGDIAGILKSIRDGFPEKGMPPWGKIIPMDEHAPTAAYVISIRGTNPPNAKAAEGELVE